MNKNTRWLMAEVDRWQAEGLVSPEQAATLRLRYAEEAEGSSWGLVLFATAASVAMGLGVILQLAYNWDKIPKFGKLGLVLGAVIVTHACGLYLQARSDWKRQLGAALSLLGTMFFGAGIFLVAQIYNINEHYPDGFLTWALGALALAWALDSVPQAMLATVLLTLWSGSEVLGFNNPNHWALALVVLGIGPLVWRHRSAVLLCMTLVSVEFILITNIGSFGTGAHAFMAAFALAVLLIAIRRLAASPQDPSVAACTHVTAFFGYAGLIFCSYIAAFGGFWDGLIRNYGSGAGHLLSAAYSWALFGLAAAGWILVAVRSARDRALRVPLGDWVAPAALLYTYAVLWGPYPLRSGFEDKPYNLILLAIAASWMLHGSRASQMRPTVLGSLLLAAVVLARYFDLFESLAARGLAFLILGAVFMVEAVYFRKNRRADQRAPGGAS